MRNFKIKKFNDEWKKRLSLYSHSQQKFENFG
jgi:hypothetical protein